MTLELALFDRQIAIQTLVGAGLPTADLPPNKRGRPVIPIPEDICCPASAFGHGVQRTSTTPDASDTPTPSVLVNTVAPARVRCRRSSPLTVPWHRPRSAPAPSARRSRARSRGCSSRPAAP